MRLARLTRVTIQLSFILGLLLLSLPSSHAQTDFWGPVNCSDTDIRLDEAWKCKSSSFCLSINQGLNAYCCPNDRACARTPQFDCDPKYSPWTDRVWSYLTKNPKKGCGNGLCCPVGYDCINGETQDESNCVLVRSDAKYPKGVDPDDPERCTNECRPIDACCPDRCNGRPCTITSTTPASSSSSQSSSSMGTNISTVTGHHTASPTASSKASATSSPAASPNPSTISGAKLAGIVVGCVLGTALLALGMWLLFKKRKRSEKTVPKDTTGTQDGTSGSPNSGPRGFFPDIPPGVRGAWAPPRPPQTYLETINDLATPLKSSVPARLSDNAVAGGSARARDDYIKPFFLNEGRTAPTPKPVRSPSTARSASLVRPPSSAAVPTDQEDTTLVGSVAAPSITEAPAQPLARSSDDGGHGDDPNGSEAYEMTRWGKAIKQTNVD